MRDCPAQLRPRIEAVTGGLHGGGGGGGGSKSTTIFPREGKCCRINKSLQPPSGPLQRVILKEEEGIQFEMRPCVDSAAGARRSTLGRLSHFLFFTFLSSLVYDRSSSSSLVALKIVDSPLPLPPFLQDERKGRAWFVVFSALPLHFTLSEGGGGRGGRKRRGGGEGGVACGISNENPARERRRRREKGGS